MSGSVWRLSRGSTYRLYARLLASARFVYADPADPPRYCGAAWRPPSDCLRVLRKARKTLSRVGSGESCQFRLLHSLSIPGKDEVISHARHADANLLTLRYLDAGRTRKSGRLRRVHRPVLRSCV